MLEGLVAARRMTAGLLRPLAAVPPEIAVVNDEGEIRRVDVLHHVGKLAFVPAVVRHVADERELESAVPRISAWHGGARREWQHQSRTDQGASDGHVVAPSCLCCYPARVRPA